MANNVQQNVQQAIRANDDIRNLIVATAMPRHQPLPPAQVPGVVTQNNNVLVFNPNLTGLLCGFLVEVNASIKNSGSSAAARTNFGAANAVARFQFTDPSSFTRISTPGYHIATLNSAKLGSWAGGAVNPNLPQNVGNINNVNSLAASIPATTGDEDLRYIYYVPVAYSMTDLRGAINLQIINATTQLQITLNSQPGYTSGDPLRAIAGGANTAVTMEDVTVTVTQVYYDQLPRNANGLVLPMVDLSTMYILNDTTVSPLVVNQDNTIPYANFRTYLSTLAIYDNAGVFNAGTDVDYWALEYANGLRQFQLAPEAVSFYTRNQVGYDFPPATYYFDHRAYPISSANYGNCQLVIRPLTVTPGAYISMCYEQFGQAQAMLGATSLPQSLA